MTASVALHIGVDASDLERLFVMAPAFSVEGDGWEAWGEPVGAAGNDARTLHVVVATTPAEADRLVAIASDLLVTLRDSTVVAVETPLDDSSVEETGGRLWHRIIRNDGTCAVIVQYVHPSP